VTGASFVGARHRTFIIHYLVGELEGVFGGVEPLNGVQTKFTTS
jgi:hypothetical protein